MMGKLAWREGWRTWAQGGLASLFPMQGRLISRIGRVQRVDPLGTASALDAARWFGHEPTIVRPDLRRIPHQDVALFRSLLGQQRADRPAASAVATPARAPTMASAADKIAATLAHLREIRGL